MDVRQRKSGYLWKQRENSSEFEKFWFSLSQGCLSYWSEKYEQEMGKSASGRIELAKCGLVLKEAQANEFRISMHQGSSGSGVVFRAASAESKAAWCETLRHSIEHQAPLCTKCKPKLIVNPMPSSTSSSQQNSNFGTPRTTPPLYPPPPPPSQTPPIQTPTQSQLNPDPEYKQPILPKKPSNASSLILKQQNCPTFHKLKVNKPNESTMNEEPIETLKLKYAKICEESSEMSSKFKLLEQIHLETMGEFERQMESAQLRQRQAEAETKRSLGKIENLGDQLGKCHDKIRAQEKEIEYFAKRLEEIEASSTSSLSSSSCGDVRGWNRDVKSLDQRINDILGRLKEREMSLSSNSPTANEQLESKCERLQMQLNEAHAKINSLLKEKKPNLQDLGDDLGKVLMSKEEVITQLEKQLKEKEKQTQELSEQLSHEMNSSGKCQEVFGAEVRFMSEELERIKQSLNEQLFHNSELVKSKETLEAEKLRAESELKNLQEFTRNELDTLQEELKTYEYKLAHSQRLAQDYQSLLEDMDVANTNFLTQFLGSSICNETTNVHNRLKRNQSQVFSAAHQMIQSKNSEGEELKIRLGEVISELEDLREENTELNDHIYSIDVFMREKEAQCDELQRERDQLLAKLDEDGQGNDYETFLKRLEKSLKTNTNNIGEFMRCVYCLSGLKDSANENEILNLVSNAVSSKAGFSDLRLVKQSIKRLLKLMGSNELMNFNGQIVSYMGEQLVHRAALNGHLKFACEVIRKRNCGVNGESGTSGSLFIECGSSTANLDVRMDEQDEKIFKLASELLQSDEGLLKKLSTQVLNEAQYLTKLNGVISTLRKIRWKQMRTKTKEAIEESARCLRIDSSDSVDSEISENEETRDEISIEQQVNCILDGI